jgi:methylmalonyl-CoA mutase
MLTQRDAYVNMLRATMATFSAGLGGANAITVSPHTLAVGLPDPFARRAARNTQLVLLEESNLAKVSDPAAGSGGIENADQAALRSRMVARSRRSRKPAAFLRSRTKSAQKKGCRDPGCARDEYRQTRDVLTGAKRIPEPARGRCRRARGKAGGAAAYGEAKFRFRSAAADAAGRAVRGAARQVGRQAQGVGARPKIFLANLGTPPISRARHLRKELLRDRRHRGAGHAGFADRRRSPPRSRPPARDIACLCSSDKVYAEHAAPAAKALQAAGASISIWRAARRTGGRAAREPALPTSSSPAATALAMLRDAWRRME